MHNAITPPAPPTAHSLHHHTLCSPPDLTPARGTAAPCPRCARLLISPRRSLTYTLQRPSSTLRSPPYPGVNQKLTRSPAVARLNPPAASSVSWPATAHLTASTPTTARARSSYPGVRENPPPCTPHHTPPPHPPHQHHAEEEPNAAKRPTPAPPLAASSSLTPG